MATSEGYIMPNPSYTSGTTGKYNYFYSLKDHLGNVRVVVVDDANATQVQTSDYTAFGVAVSTPNTSVNKYLYNDKELQDGTNWLDYGARMYQPELGRFFNIDPMAEASEDFSPYQYAVNNPILSIDLFGLTDVNNDGKDDGTLLDEVVVRARRTRSNSNESTLDNIQLTLDVWGLYPGAGTIAGVINGGIDVGRRKYGSAAFNFTSAIPGVGTVMKGSKFAVMGAKAISSMAKMKVLKAGVIAFYSRGKVMFGKAINSHHIIPERLFTRLSKEGLFDDVPGFDVDELYNRIDLPGVGKGLKNQFHGKHPDLTDKVENMLRDFSTQSGGKLTPQDINKTLLYMEQEIKNAYDNFKATGQNLNQFFK